MAEYTQSFDDFTKAVADALEVLPILAKVEEEYKKAKTQITIMHTEITSEQEKIWHEREQLEARQKQLDIKVSAIATAEQNLASIIKQMRETASKHLTSDFRKEGE